MPVLERSWEGDAFCAETITKFATNVTLTTKHTQCYNYFFELSSAAWPIWPKKMCPAQSLMVDDDGGRG